jgi:septal ring factor EnvC (AmiA/AmiB activator)
LNREKRQRAELEKQRRKVEGELRITQETVADLERSKRDLENTIARKEKDIGALDGVLDDEQGGVGRVQRTSRRLRLGLKNLRKSLRLRGRLGLRLRDKGLTWPGSLKSLVNASMKLEVQLCSN